LFASPDTACHAGGTGWLSQPIRTLVQIGRYTTDNSVPSDSVAQFGDGIRKFFPFVAPGRSAKVRHKLAHAANTPATLP
jgi:hypothetical protein